MSTSRDDWPWLYNEDGSLIEHRVLDELTDYKTMLTEVRQVYSAITGGQVSYPNTYADAVLKAHEEVIELVIREAVYEALFDALASPDPYEYLERIKPDD